MDNDVQKQGESYEEMMDDTKGFKLPAVPKKAVIIGGVVIVAIILIAILQGVVGREPATEPPDTGIAVDGDGWAVPIFGYDTSEKEELRALGYTGTEIENYEAQGMSAEILIAEAKLKHKSYLKDLYIELQDGMNIPSSPQFEELKNLTWLGGTPYVFDVDTTESWRTSNSTTEIVQYTKIPARGLQLFVKLVTEEGDVLFMQVPPNRYAELKDNGGMVISYTTVTYDDRVFVTKVEEVKVE
jgi:hypothetical protein